MSGALGGPRVTTMVRTAGGVSRLDVLGERAVAIGVGLLIVTRFASSYTTLRDLAVDVGGFPPWLAPVVPLSFDVGIIVLSLKVVLAARAGLDARVLRTLVLLLSAATVVANGAASSTAVGRLLHAVPPAMFVICFETLASSAHHDARGGRTVTRPDPPDVEEALPVLTAARWLLAPRQTWSIWRARVLAVAPFTLPAPPAAPPVLGLAVRAAPGLSPLRQLAAETGAGPSSDTSRGWLAEGPRDLSVASDAGPAGPPAPVGRRSSADPVTPTGHRDRLAVAVDALRADPTMTAVALAEHLGGAGHPVSVRTAQRIRHQAEQHLGTPTPDALSPGGHQGWSG